MTACPYPCLSVCAQAAAIYRHKSFYIIEQFLLDTACSQPNSTSEDVCRRSSRQFEGEPCRPAPKVYSRGGHLSLALIRPACQIISANRLGMTICPAALHSVTRQVSVKGCRIPARRHQTGLLHEAPCTTKHRCQGFPPAQKVATFADSRAKVSTIIIYPWCAIIPLSSIACELLF